MIAAPPRCSVLVPVLDEERDIADAVAAMQAQTVQDIELIFADGGSRDRTRAILARLASEDPRIHVHDNPRRTVTSGLNVALSQARGRFVARFDAHSVFPRDYVERGIARLQAGDTLWVSGPQVPVGRSRISRAVALALGGGLGQAGSRKWAARASEWELDTGLFCGVWERRTLLEFGGWDERWQVNEDSEMAARMLARGERLVALGAMAAEYRPRDTLPGLWRQYRTYGTFRIRTAVHHPASLRAEHLVAPALVATGAAALLGPRRRRRLARLAMAAYAAMLARAGLRVRPAADDDRDVALVPVVLATMHLSFGVGTWSGMMQFGVPLRAFAHLAGARTRIDPEVEVYAPSLTSHRSGP